jgi:cytochrome P450
MTLVSRIARRLRGWRRAATGPAPAPEAASGPTTAATADLSARDVARNPFPHWEALRAGGPVQYLARHDAWIVLGYDAVKAAFAQPQIFSNMPYGQVDAVLLGADPPVHAAMRRLVSRHFTPEALRRLDAAAARIADRLVRPQLDAVGGFAGPLSRGVAAELIGFDEAAVADILAGSEAAGAAADPLAALIAGLDAAAPSARLYPDLLSDGEGLIGDAEARSLVRLLWLAANTTTERVIVHSVLRLVEDPALQERVRGDGRLVAPLVEEVMRLHPPEHLVPRLTLSAVELGGVAIPAGAVVHLAIGAANRDPAHFEAPAELRLDRPSKRHFAFGSGVHHCVGAPLARRVIGTALTTLIGRSTQLRPLQPLDSVPYFATMTALSPERLEIAL